MEHDTGLDWLNTVSRLNIHITLDQAWPQHKLSYRSPHDAAACAANREAPPVSASAASPAVPPIASTSRTTASESTPPDRWMSLLPDATPLSALTIPGTHDSAARPPLPFVQTQSLSITDQLATLGVRALDLRLRRDPSEGDRLYCYHGGVPLGPSLGSRLPLDDVMTEIWRFLEAGGDDGSAGRSGEAAAAAENRGSGAAESSRSGETVLILINNDNASDSRDAAGRAAFYRAVEAFVAATPPWQDAGAADDDDKAQDQETDGSISTRTNKTSTRASASRWYTESRAPRLGEVRGRVVLLRRFPVPDETGNAIPTTPLGLDLSAWVNDSPDFTIVSPYNRFRVQDKWLYPKRVPLEELIASKSAHVRYMMERAASDDQRGRVRRLQPQGGKGEVVEGTDDDLWYINFCSAVGERFKYGEVAHPKSVAGGAFVGWSRKWVDGVNALTAEYLATSLAGSSQSTSGTLGLVFMDFPELPAGNNLVRQLIQTNF